MSIKREIEGILHPERKEREKSIPAVMREPRVMLDYSVIKEALYRAISSIKNKPEVQKKEGRYYRDFLFWTTELEKIKKLEGK